MDLDQEKLLVEQAKGDIEAFGKLYDIYYPRIFGYIIKRTAGIDAALDITSEVFFKALKNLQQFQWRGVPFSAWLYRIANNEVANYYRGNGHQQHELDIISNSIDFSEPSSESEFIVAETELARKQQFLELHIHISSLAMKYQEVITLRYFEGKLIYEIAEILGKREGTVKSLLHRGLKKLRKIMEDNATF
jgi:RNA polymerase sigma-70 factor (ECF subfamily)